MADIRRAQLQQFKVLMQGIISQLKSHSPLDQMLGFHGGMMREASKIADALGWRPKNFDDSPHFRTKQVPFNISESGSGLTIFGPYGETVGTATEMIPSDEQNESWGARRTDTGWEYDVAASEKLYAWCEQYRQLMLNQTLPLLESWLTTADLELAALEATSEAKPVLADGSKPVKRRGRLTKEESEIRRNDMLATLARYPDLANDIAGLASRYRVDAKTIQRWTKDEAQKIAKLAANKAEDDEDRLNREVNEQMAKRQK